MNKIKILSIALGITSLFVLSCKKDDNNGQNNHQPKDTTTTKPPEVSLEDTICRSWEVQSATHNGSPDASSTGLVMWFHKDGSYDLVGMGFSGTWEFIENKTKVLLDKADPDLKTTWTIKRISSSHLDVSFKSPFTGGAAEWNMIPD